MVHNPAIVKIGDLVVERTTKKAFIILEVRPYKRKAYGEMRGSMRQRFLVVSPAGKQTWKVDTALKVEFYLPGSTYFDDIR
tara:strand:+ start:117 stop:359 length:243 start_codon:yes stop_codon:yes gene_type:complete